MRWTDSMCPLIVTVAACAFGQGKQNPEQFDITPKEVASEQHYVPSSTTRRSRGTLVTLRG